MAVGGIRRLPVISRMVCLDRCVERQRVVVLRVCLQALD